MIQDGSTDQAKQQIARIRGAFSSLRAPLEGEIALEYIKQLEDMFRFEEERNQQIESKGVALLGAAGIIATLLAGVLGFFFSSKNIHCGLFTASLILFLFSLGVMIISIAFCIFSLKIRIFSYPGNMEDILRDLTEPRSYKKIRTEKIQDLMVSLSINIYEINRKVDFIKWGLISFISAISVLFVASILLGIYILK